LHGVRRRKTRRRLRDDRLTVYRAIVAQRHGRSFRAWQPLTIPVSRPAPDPPSPHPGSALNDTPDEGPDGKRGFPIFRGVTPITALLPSFAGAGVTPSVLRHARPKW